MVLIRCCRQSLYVYALVMRTQITHPFLPHENTLSVIHKCWTCNLQRVLIPQLTATIAMWGKEKSSQIVYTERLYMRCSSEYSMPSPNIKGVCSVKRSIVRLFLSFIKGMHWEFFFCGFLELCWVIVSHSGIEMYFNILFQSCMSSLDSICHEEGIMDFSLFLDVSRYILWEIRVLFHFYKLLRNSFISIWKSGLNLMAKFSREE